jgi:hypothetical protein
VVIPLEIPVPRERDLDHLRTWVRERQPAPAPQKKQLMAAIDAWERLHESRRRTGDLELVVAAAMSQYAAIWCTCTELLGRLISIAPGAREAFEQAMKKAKAAQRRQLISGLYYCVDRDFSREMLRQSLHDKSAVVRERAAEKAEDLAMVELADEMLKQEQVEKKQGTLDVLRHNRLLLTQGWYLKPSPDPDQMVLVVRLQHGGTPGRWISAQDLRERTLEQLICSMRESGRFGVLRD